MLDRNTPLAVRLTVYALHEAVSVVRDVLRAPMCRRSYGRLLNLPRFGVLSPRTIFRSAEPRTAAHAAHLIRLGVRTLICVRDAGPSPATVAIARRARIRLLVFDLGRDCGYRPDSAWAATDAALDPDNQPVLIHCGGGRHRAGMVCGLVRQRQGWTTQALLDEYWAFAQPSPFADNIELIVRCAGARPSRQAAVASARSRKSRHGSGTVCS